MAAEYIPLNSGITHEAHLTSLPPLNAPRSEFGMPSFPIEDVYIHPEDIPEYLIKNERNAILAEAQNDEARPERQVHWALMEMLYGRSNPLFALNLETSTSINTIETPDLAEHVNVIFKPSDLVISVFSEGKNCKELVDGI